MDGLYVCAKCGTSVPANGEPQCVACGSLELRRADRWRWLAVHEWFVLVATLIAGVTAFINS
jgi:hypothetical protein